MVIELKVSQDFQSEAVATHVISAGTCILIEEPFADVTTLNTCAHCYRVINRSTLLSRRRPCLKCNQVMYCGKKCKIAHEGVHAAYCDAFKMGAAHHRKLSKSQEHLAVLTAQCISRVFLEAEREGICGVHALYRGLEGFPSAPDKWLYDDSICKLLCIGGNPPINPGEFDLSGMLQRAAESDFPPDSIGNVKDFLFLTGEPIDGDGVLDGWSNESLEASLDICNAILRRWLCTCNSKWSDSSSDKMRIIKNVMKTVLNHGVFTEVRWPAERISTQMSEVLPTSMTNPNLSKTEAMPLDRRKSGIIEEHSIRACDAYLPSIAGFNKPGAYGLWPRLSLLTHSCVPNCFVYWHQNRAVVVTLRVIPQGERLTIAKCSLLLPYPSRTLILKSRYNFTCLCERCVTKGQITLQDVDSITRDLAPVIPDESIINGLTNDPMSYLNIDYGLCATKHYQQLCVFEQSYDQRLTDRRVKEGRGNSGGTPETIDPSHDDRCLSFNEVTRLPTLPNDANQNSEVLMANCEVTLLNHLMGTLKHQTSARSFDALCDVTASTLENRLNPLSLHLYQLRREMVMKDWRAAAKQLVFFSFVYRHCEGHLDRIEELERLGLLLKRDYYTKRLSIGRRRAAAGVPPAKVNYGGTVTAAAGDGSNHHQSVRRSFVSSSGNPPLTTTTLYSNNLLIPTKEADREVIAEALRCIFREVQFGYQNLFGAEFGRTKQAGLILADLTK